MRFSFGFLCFFLSILLLANCTERECTNLDNPRLTVVFKTRDQATRQRPERDTALQLVNLQGVGRPKSDTLLLGAIPSSTRATSIILPLSQTADVSSFEMRWIRVDTSKKPVDTLRYNARFMVKYAREPFFLSEDCGFDYRFRELTVESLTVEPTSIRLAKDSVIIIKNVVDETNTPNIKIYF